MIIDLRENNVKLNECYVKIVLIPLGSLEWHGEHLPPIVDTVLAEHMADYCLNQLKHNSSICLIKYPTLPYGYSPEWINKVGTVSLSSETYIAVLREIINSINMNVEPNGFILLNAHGGNYGLLRTIAIETYVNIKRPVVIIDLWRIAKRFGLEYCHACELEAKLYGLFFKVNVNWSNRVYCRELDGAYLNYEPGFCGNSGIDPIVFLSNVCKEMSKAVDEIITKR